MGAGMALAGMTGAAIREHALLTIGSKGAVDQPALGATSAGGAERHRRRQLRIGQFNLERILKAFLPCRAAGAASRIC